MADRCIPRLSSDTADGETLRVTALSPERVKLNEREG